MASAKPAGKAGAKVPASIAKLSMEELQSMCVDTLKKLRARDKRIEELVSSTPTASPAKVREPVEDGAAAEVAALHEKVRSLSEELAAAREAASAAQRQARQLRDSEEATAALREQLASLKDALRCMAADKEATDAAAAAASAELAAARAETAQLRTALDGARAEVNAMAQGRDEASEAAAARLAETETALTAAREEATAASAELEEVLVERDSAAVKAATELTALQGRLASTEGQLAAAREELTTAQADSQGQEGAAREFEAGRKLLETAEAVRKEAAEQLDSSRAEVERLQAELDAQTQGRDVARADAAEAVAQQEQKVADLTGQLDSAEETLTELRAQLDTRDAAAKDAAEAQQKQVTELAAMRSAKDQSNAELAGANAERERLSAELASVKEALGATQAKLAGLAATAAKQPPQVTGGEGTAGQEAAETVRAEAAEREAAEARAALELVERQRKALQDVMAGERKAHAAALGDQVMAVAAAEARAEGAASRVAALEQQLATAAATDRPASAGGSASGEEFLEVRVAELTAQLHEFRDLAAAMTPPRASGRDAAIEKLGSPDHEFAGFTNPMYVSELEAKLEAAERRITELDAAPKTANFPEPAAAADGTDEAEALRAELAAAHERLGDADRLAGTVAELQGELSFLRKEHQIEMEEAATRALALETHMEAAQARVAELQQSQEMTCAEEAANDAAGVESAAADASDRMVADLRAELDEAKRRQLEASTKLEAALAAASDAEQRLSAAQSELRAAEGHATAAVELRERVSALEQQLETSRSEATAAPEAGSREAAAAAQAAARDADARIQAAERRSEEATAATAAAETAADAAAERALALEAELAGVRAEFEQAQCSAAVPVPPEKESTSNGHVDGEALAAELASAKEALSAAQQERDAAVQTLADTERRFVQMAKKKQAEHSTKLKDLEAQLTAATEAAAEAKASATTADASAGRDYVAAVSDKDRVLAELLSVKTNHEQELSQLRAELEAREDKLAGVNQELAAVRDALSAAEQSGQKRSAKLEAEASAAAQAAEAAKAAAAKLRKDQENERERVKKLMGDMRKKLDRATKEKQRAEVAAAELRGKGDAEVEALRGAVAAAEQRTAEVHSSVERVANELRDYKARAHVLLKAKETELRVARETGAASETHQAELAAAKAALAEAHAAAEAALAEAREAEARGKAELDAAVAGYEEQMDALQRTADERQAAAESSARAVEQWQKRHIELEARLEQLQGEYARASTALDAAVRADGGQLAAARAAAEAAAAEAEAARAEAHRMAEAREAAMAEMLEANASLRAELQAALMRQADVAALPSIGTPSARERSKRQSIFDDGDEAEFGRGASSALDDTEALPDRVQGAAAALSGGDLELEDLLRRGSEGGLGSIGDGGLPETQLLALAQRQAERDRELAAAHRRIQELQAEVQELLKEVNLRQMQEQALKEALREVEREQKRVNFSERPVDMEYLKNTVLQLYQMREMAPMLLPVLATMLQFSPAEVAKCQEASSRTEAPAGVDRESVLTASSFGSGLHRHSCDGSLSSSTASSSMASSPKAFLQRFSFDSSALKPPLGYEASGRPPLHSNSMPIPRHAECGLRATTSSDYYVEPVPSAPASESASVPPRRRKEGKIDGLDYWGFCELLRSSSL